MQTNTLILPDINIKFSSPKPARKILAIAGGRAPKAKWLKKAAAGCEVWCIDKGVDACRAAGIVPSLLIGDNDSASCWEWAESLGAITERFPAAKDFTDTQLAIQRIKKMAERPFLILTGAFGGRLDHLFSAVNSFASSELSGCLADGAEFLIFIRDDESIDVEMMNPPIAFSLLSFSDICGGVTLKGARWELTDATLSRREPYSVSNEFSGNKISLALQSGCLAFYCCAAEGTL